MRPRYPYDSSDVDGESRWKSKIEPRLATAEQLEIDGCQQTTVDLGAVLDAAREVDAKAATQCVEACRGSRKTAARHHQRINITRRDRLALQARQLRVQKGQVELGVMNHQRVRADE